MYDGEKTARIFSVKRKNRVSWKSVAATTQQTNYDDCICKAAKKESYHAIYLGAPYIVRIILRYAEGVVR